MSKPSKTVQHALAVLRNRVLYKRAVFALPSTVPGRLANEQDTAAIREATRLYVQTWVLPIIDAIAEGDTRLLSELTKRVPA